MKLKIALLATAAVLISAPSLATECPQGVKSCIVVTMTPDEVQSLIGPGMLLDQSEWANRSGMSALVSGWKQKLQQSPAGEVKSDAPPKASAGASK